MSTINKLIVALFVVTTLFFTGCSRDIPNEKDSIKVSDKQDKEKKDKDEPKKLDKDDSGKEEQKSSKDGIYTEPGMELTDFYDAFNGAMARFEKAINIYEPDDFELFDIAFDYIAATSNIVSITQFDYLEPGDNVKETGKNGKFDAVREKKGNIITFSESMTREEDGLGSDDLKGDVIEIHGTLDTETNTLILEDTTKRDGQIIARTVNEVVMLPDGTFLAQIIDKPKKPRDDRIEDKGTAHFIHCSKDNLEIITADFEPDVNFTYESIVGNADATPESMSEGYKRVRQLIAEGDVATAKKY